MDAKNVESNPKTDLWGPLLLKREGRGPTKLGMRRPGGLSGVQGWVTVLFFRSQ